MQGGDRTGTRQVGRRGVPWPNLGLQPSDRFHMSEARIKRRLLQKALGKAEAAANRLVFNCLYPGCSNTAIRSHSQQREQQLRSISQAGEVYALRRNTYQGLKDDRD